MRRVPVGTFARYGTAFSTESRGRSVADTSAAHAASEVLEEHAEGDLKGIFADIKSTCRFPIVNAVFGALATHPDYLRVAWRQLHTNLQTVYFEQRADEIRRLAVESMAAIGEVRTPVSEPEIGSVLEAFHYVNPKLLLAVSALRSSLLGQVPRVTIVAPSEKRQLVPGSPSAMPALEVVSPNAQDPRVRRLFDEIRSVTPGGVLTTDYRALARWPDYLEGAWSALQTRTSSKEYTRAIRGLRWLADEAVLGFPFRMDVTPHSLRHAGLSDAQIDSVRELLDHHYGALSASVANIAVLTTGFAGKSEALENRFPAAVT